MPLGSDVPDNPTWSSPGTESGPGLSRRTILAWAAAGIPVGVLLDSILADPAFAEPAWRHPFQTRGTIVAGGHFNSWVLDNGDPRQTQHKGLDYSPPGAGTLIQAVAGGTVLESEDGTNSYGSYVLIRHDSTWQSLYAHMQFGSREVAAGDTVLSSSFLGRVGNTGVGSGAHLHIELRQNGIKVDPQPKIHTAQLASAQPTPPPAESQTEMILFNYNSTPLWALSAPGLWWETPDGVLADKIKAYLGGHPTPVLSPTQWNSLKAACLASVPVPTP
jgi:murein DD-endopeptidase MepM/ murein hydrolase activator NlpD